MCHPDKISIYHNPRDSLRLQKSLVFCNEIHANIILVHPFLLLP